MKRLTAVRLLSLFLSVLLSSSILMLPASASGYTTVYNKLANLAKNGYYHDTTDPLEGEKYYYIAKATPEYSEYCVYPDHFFELVYTTTDRLELRFGSNSDWTWVIIPKNPGEPWHAKVKYGNNRASALIDPASFNEDTELTLYTFNAEESYREIMPDSIKQGMIVMLDFLTQYLDTMGYVPANIGFSYYSSNDAHCWYQYNGKPRTCTSDGYGDFVCMYCAKKKHEEMPSYGGHSWDNGRVLNKPTCTEGGCLLYTCTRCGDFYDVDIPALGHAWTLTEVLTEGEEGLHSCTGLYTCTRCNETKEARLCAAEVFTDMPAEGNWAHDPIDWAYFNGITAGKSPTTFNPKDTVTRAEAMTFLWKTLDSPEPGTTENPFADVKEGKYYYKPVLWAVENGITSGTSETTFGPKDPCTRAQILTFLWIAAGRPEPETTENPFADVKEGKYYYKAVLWGVENHITSGVAPDEFGPNQTCTRAQIVAFLYKAKDLMHQDPDTP